jgi:hypothetical protein
MKCEFIMYTKCPNGHQQSWKCHAGIPLTCAQCERDKKAAEKKQKEDFKRQQREDAARDAHLKEIQKLEDEMAREQEAMRDARLAKERADALAQKQKDLEEMRARARNLAQQSAKATTPVAPTPTTSQSAGSNPAPSPLSSAFGYIKSAVGGLTSPGGGSAVPDPTPSTSQPIDVGENNPPPKPLPTPSEKEWKRRKDVEGASNDAIDAIMGLIGLEEVKGKVLEIYDKVEATRRQGTDVKRERANIVFLGNPETGMLQIPYISPTLPHRDYR